MQPATAAAATERCCSQVGLKLLREDGRVFACYSAMADTIYYAEACIFHGAALCMQNGRQGGIYNTRLWHEWGRSGSLQPPYQRTVYC